MEPEELTIEMLEEAWGEPADKWHGKCSQLAHAAIGVLGHGHYAYGHFLGDVDPEGFWSVCGLGLQRHGWTLLDDGRIVDPTRWSFENVEPYIYIGENGGDYDEGGNGLRSLLRTPCPSAEGEACNLKEVMCSSSLFEKVTDTPFDKITRDQALWVANMPYTELGFAVAPIYETLIANGMKVFIPTDNYSRALREGRVKTSDG